MESLKKQYLGRLLEEEKEELHKNADVITAFKDYTALKGLPLSDSNFKYIQTIGIVVEYPNILSYLYVGLISDKDGLFEFSTLENDFEKNMFMEGYFYSVNFVIIAHENFRRGFYIANNFAPRFIELFWKFNESNVQKLIALDLDRVRINMDNARYMEHDTWYGAKFNDDIETISDGVSKLRPPLELDDFDISFFFNDSYSLDVKWSTKEGIKTLQMEEFKTDIVKILRDDIEYYPVRYVHAEFDLKTNFFRHFDGAIHFYTSEEYFKRRDSDFNYNSKNASQIKSLSQKLFKLDGEVSTDAWITFTSHFFSGNPLIIEYFEGKYPDHIEELLTKIRSNN